MTTDAPSVGHTDLTSVGWHIVWHHTAIALVGTGGKAVNPPSGFTPDDITQRQLDLED